MRNPIRISGLIIIAVLITSVFHSSVRCEAIVVCDYVPDASAAGNEIFEIVTDNGYSAEYCNALTGEEDVQVFILFSGVLEYGQGYYVSEEQLDKIRALLDKGTDVVAFGLSNLLHLPWSKIGVEQLMGDTYPMEFLSGGENTFLEGFYFRYPEIELNPPYGYATYSYANPQHMVDSVALEADNNSIAKWRGDYYENDRSDYRAVSLNIDPSLIDEQEGYNTKEELLLTILQDYLGYFPTSVDDEPVNIPNEIRLEQNYPNPFNAVTTIGYYIPHPGEAELSVYNLLGETVAEFVNSHSRSGYHNIHYNASDYSSGIYFYKLTAGSESITRRMT
ncbi:MAG: T9SS type A sorting domain-containing protein, partial [candidate division Zixibacteria bacterium]|nr:T9SS type A sorting domain-containing protein [candidate division Zixibacteria bacterium]